MGATERKRRRGRPRRESAESHEQIIQAVYDLLHEQSLDELTIEAVAQRAGVGKPTIYKWWPSKAALVLDMFEERVVPELAVPKPTSAEAAIRRQVGELIRLLNGFFGRVSSQLIAEGQWDRDVLEEYRRRYISQRRAFTRGMIEQAIADGEFAVAIDPELLIDMIYGPIYYRLLVGHGPLDAAFGNQLVDHVMAYLKPQRPARPRPKGKARSR